MPWDLGVFPWLLGSFLSWPSSGLQDIMAVVMMTSLYRRSFSSRYLYAHLQKLSRSLFEIPRGLGLWFTFSQL
jgi:hypothetical protein